MNNEELLVELNSLKSFILQLQSKQITQMDTNTQYKDSINDIEKRLKDIEDSDDEATADDSGSSISKDELSPTTLKVIGGSIEIGHEFSKSYS